MAMAARKDHFGCPGELFWLAGGIILVSQGSRIKATQNLPDVRSLTYASSFSLLPMLLPKREYNAVPAIVDEIW